MQGMRLRPARRLPGARCVPQRADRRSMFLSPVTAPNQSQPLLKGAGPAGPSLGGVGAAIAAEPYFDPQRGN